MAFFAPGTASAQMHGGGMGHHRANGASHDEVNMPGLRGLDATPEESGELAAMFRNFEKIERTGTEFTITMHEAVWKGKYFKTFTYYEVDAVNLGKLPPGDYTVKWIVKPLIFKQLEKPREAQNNYQTNWPADEEPAESRPVEIKTAFSVRE